MAANMKILQDQLAKWRLGRDNAAVDADFGAVPGDIKNRHLKGLALKHQSGFLENGEAL